MGLKHSSDAVSAITSLVPFQEGRLNKLDKLEKRST